MTISDRRFYSALGFSSALAFLVFGYLTIFSIGLGMLVLAVASAVAAAVILPRPLRVAMAVLESALALVPFAWLAVAALTD